MSLPPTANSTAIRLPSDPARIGKFETAVGSSTWESARRFLPKDDDELNAALIAREFARVCFVDLDSLLEMLWKNQADLEQWQAAGVQIELSFPPEGGTSWRALTAEVHQSLRRWRSQQRRRQIVAAVLLSAIALVAMAVLFWLIPPAR